MNYILSIRDLSVDCHIGCSEEEQQIAQEVKFSLVVEFEKEPDACHSDQLNNSLCYESLCTEVKSIAESRPFRTIEALCYLIHCRLRDQMPHDCQWNISVTKVQPPIVGLKNGVSFEIGDQK